MNQTCLTTTNEPVSSHALCGSPSTIPAFSDGWFHGLIAGGRYRLEVVDHSAGTCEAYRPHSDSGAGPGRSRPAMCHVQPGAKAGRERLKVEATVVTLGAAQEMLGATY